MKPRDLNPSSLILALLLIAGCRQSAEESFKLFLEPLRAADTLEFLTIDPQIGSGAEAESTLEGHAILGRTTLNRDRFGVILDGLETMVASGDSSKVMACFTPGYALREPTPGGAVVLICLECRRVRFARDGRGSGATLDSSTAPGLEPYLAGLVQEFDLPTFEQP